MIWQAECNSTSTPIWNDRLWTENNGIIQICNKEALAMVEERREPTKMV